MTSPNQVKWAKDFVRRYEGIRSSSAGNGATGGISLELYNLAKAIIADSEGA